MSDKESTPRVQVKKPETTEDLVLLAVEKAGLEEVVRLLRDWCGSGEIRKCLNRLNYRDTVDRFTHARRHAVEIYAKQHGLTPASLMVEIVGELGRKDSWEDGLREVSGSPHFMQAHVAVVAELAQPKPKPKPKPATKRGQFGA